MAVRKFFAEIFASKSIFDKLFARLAQILVNLF